MSQTPNTCARLSGAEQVAELLLRGHHGLGHVEVVAEVEQGRHAQEREQRREPERDPRGSPQVARRRARDEPERHEQHRSEPDGHRHADRGDARRRGHRKRDHVLAGSERGEQRHEPERHELLDASLHGEGVDQRGLSGESRHGRPAPARLDDPVQQADQAERERGRDEGQVGLEDPRDVGEGERPDGGQRGMRRRADTRC